MAVLSQKHNFLAEYPFIMTDKSYIFHDFYFFRNEE